MSSNLEDAISVAVGIARDHGVAVEKPIALRSTNNTVAWLYPAPIVAKIGTGRFSRLATELKVAQELAALGAPVVHPAREMPPSVHFRDGLGVTFWRYHAQSSPVQIPAGRIAAALRQLHAAMAKLSSAVREHLPTYMQHLNSARSRLADPDDLQALSAPDRRLLAATFDRLQVEMIASGAPENIRVLHGEPHSGNILVVGGDLAFIDFETVCTGPVEWDLAHIDELGYGLPVNPRLLWACQGMVSAKTATLCWADVERGDFREHAEWHLSNLKTNIAPQLFHANSDSKRLSSDDESILKDE
ncbi:MAG TPA: aminoglycoside phosphotransferase family protein [Steroidobacteraceae bacterium]|nr:aminoglycoside phosphotransferase family protein [Steroidobacteraceae bacterium]